MKKINKIILLETFTPCNIRSRVFSSDMVFLKLYQRKKDDELRELKIHLENSKYSEIFIEGGEVSVAVLSKLNNETIEIIAGKNKSYFFKLYIDVERQKTICYTLIKRKVQKVN